MWELEEEQSEQTRKGTGTYVAIISTFAVKISGLAPGERHQFKSLTSSIGQFNIV
jgi:hypothetical protein